MKNVIIVALMLVGSIGQAQQYMNNTVQDDFNIYQERYNKANVTGKIGAGLAISGAGVFLLSQVILLGVETDYYGEPLPGQESTLAVAGFGLIYSFVAFNVGMPLWMSSIHKKNVNKKMMRRYQPVSLNVGATNNGVGLILKL